MRLKGDGMAEAVVVFLSQFVFVMLKGPPQINVVKGRTVAAMGVSFALGVCGLSTLGIVTTAINRGGNWCVYAAFLVGGPAGISAAMWREKRCQRKRNITS